MTPRIPLAIVLAAWTAFALADFVPDDQVVSDPTSDLPQPEFDRATNRIIWEDRLGRLWAGNVHPSLADPTRRQGSGGR